MRKEILILTTLIVAGIHLHAQQTPIYSQYVLNEFILNPAVAGSDGMTSINITGRRQWLGIQYGPETYSVSASTRILKSMKPFVSKRKPGESSIKKGASGKVGLGASIIKDRNGAVNKTSMNFTYAYHISMYQSQLSFGLTMLINQFQIDNDFAKLKTPGDPLDGLIGPSSFSPDAGLGVDFSGPNYHGGISIINLFQAPIKIPGGGIDYKQLKHQRQYYILGTYKGKLENNEKWEYEPAIAARVTEKLQGTAEGSIRFIYDNEYWAGLSLRTSGDLIVLMGVRFTKFYFGYSFDYGFSELSRLSYGSHEIVMAIKMGDSTSRYRYWQRY